MSISGAVASKTVELPAGWTLRTLASLSQVVTGSTPPTSNRSYYGDEFPFVSPADLNGAPYVFETTKRLSASGFAISRKLPPLSVLFTCIGSTIGKCAIAAVELTSNQQINAVLPRDDFSPEYLYYVLSLLAPGIRQLAGTQAIPIISKSQFENTFVPVPGLSEQRAIAATLSDVDALTGLLDKLIAKKRAIKLATTQQLLTGKTRLPGFLSPWPSKTVGEFANCTAGRTPSTSVPTYWGGSIRWMSSGELNFKVVHEVKERITEAGLRNSAAKMLPANCVLIGLAGQGKTRGTVAINKVPLATNQSIAAILPNGTFYSEYLYYNLDMRYDELRGMSSGEGGRGGLNLRIIRSIQVPFPCVKEQIAIAQVLCDMDAEIVALERRRDKTKAIKLGMMQALLTGRVRMAKKQEAVGV